MKFQTWKSRNFHKIYALLRADPPCVMGQIKDDFSSHSDTLRTIALRHLAYYFLLLPEYRFGAPLAIPFPVVALEQHGAEIEMINSKEINESTSFK